MRRCDGRETDTGLSCPLEAEDGQNLCRACASRRTQERFAFAGWMRQVAIEMEAAFGLHPGDLPDRPYADWHDSGLEPDEAARRAIADAMDETPGRGRERRERE